MLRDMLRKMLRDGMWLLVGATGACASPAVPTAPGPSNPFPPPSVNCSVFAESRGSEYVLPFGVGQQFLISRTFDHYLASNGGVGLYAIDALMPIGTPVHAIRRGSVVAVEERFSDDDHAESHENFVMIRHADGTVARYIHLTANGAAAAVGDVVEQGQLVAFSGNSGPTSAPHLHFDVQSCGPNLPPGWNAPPCGQTVPLTFRNTETQTCGLEPRKVYTAQVFTPDPR